MKVTSYKDRYILSISEFLNSKGIMQLLNCNQNVALKIRKEAIKYCINNHITIYGKNSIPTEAILKVSNRDIDYFYQKMLLEAKVV